VAVPGGGVELGQPADVAEQRLEAVVGESLGDLEHRDLERADLGVERG
jgi:hypothetical protein